MTKKELLERVRTLYRTTYSGRRVRNDEPGEHDDNPDVIAHNAYVSKMMKQKQQQKQSKERLKSSNKVPTKNGKPIFEKNLSYDSAVISEDLNRFLQQIRKNLYSSKRMTFREWLSAIEDIIDEL